MVLWKNHIKGSVVTQIDAKTTLQELTLKNFKKLPTYKTITNTNLFFTMSNSDNESDIINIKIYY